MGVGYGMPLRADMETALAACTVGCRVQDVTIFFEARRRKDHSVMLGCLVIYSRKRGWLGSDRRRCHPLT